MTIPARRLAIVVAAAFIAPTSLHAQSSSFSPGAGLELWTSADSDKTDVVKVLGRTLWDFEGRDKFQGVAIERAWFRPQGQHVRKQTRAYLDFADSFSSKWLWRAKVGSDGHTVLGSASVRASDWSKEFFLEREIVETPRGVDHGIYYTFGGASFDLPAGDSDMLNAMGGVQTFTGSNVRLHLRGSYVHVADRKLGLSLQLRGRYFHSTVPGEFDYYSPRDFVQLIPVVQMRRFDRNGWMYLAAIGYGAQKATASHWQGARLADLRIESPARSRKLQVFAQIAYSNNSITGAGAGYNYVSAHVGLTAALR